MEKEWLRTHIRQVHMDFHMPEFPVDAIKNFNAESFVRNLIHGKINMVALFAKCHFGNSFYNTKAGHKHTGLAEDFLMETAIECRKHNIKTVAYYSLSTDVLAYNEHPNWRLTHADGSPAPINGPWARVCINSPYREELVLPQLEEVIKDYPVDGLFIDIPFAELCFCDGCKAKFKLMYGKDLTESVPELERRAFSQNSTARFLHEVHALFNKYSKDMRIITNQAGRIEVARTFSIASDYGVWESQPKSNYLSHSFAARTVRTQDNPLVQVMSVRFYSGWGDLTLKPAAQMTTEFASMIGNGSPASSGDQVNVDGTLQSAVYDMFNKSMGFVEEREAILSDAKSITETAILAPVPREDYPAPNSIGAEMNGANKALIESHIQFDILNSLDIHKLKDYKYVVLTEPNDFADTVYEALREWVKAGGILVAAGASLVHNGKMELEDVLGVKYLEPLVFSVSHFLPHQEIMGEMDNLTLQCRGRAQKVIIDGATNLADLVYPQGESIPTRAFRNQNCPPPKTQVSGYPFVTIHKYGKGKAVYIAGPVFRIYWETNHHWLRQLVDGIFKYINPQPIYSVDAPATVEVNMMAKSKKQYLLNLIHYQVGHQGDPKAIPSIEKVYPLHNINCMVKLQNVKEIHLRPENTSLQFVQNGEYVEFSVPEIKYLAIVDIVLQ